MKKAQLYIFLQRFAELKDLKGAKFAYFLLKNKKNIIEEIQILEKIKMPNKQYEEYDKKRIELCKKYSLKDKDGNPIIIQQAYNIDDQQKEVFDKEQASLEEQYKKIVEEHDEKIKNFNKLLSEDADISIFYIKQTDLPDDITSAQLEIIFDMIQHDCKK